MCGVCCRNLRAQPGPFPDELKRAGIHRVEGPTGLPLGFWERERFLEAAHRLSIDPPLRPSWVVFEKNQREALVLLEVLDSPSCPLHEVVAPPLGRSRIRPLAEGGVVVCRIYEQRPLACRSFPIVVRGGEYLLSSLCPDLVHPPPSRLEELRREYPQEVEDARSSLFVLPALLEFLSAWEMTTGALLLKNLDESEVHKLLSRWKVVPILDRLSQEGLSERLLGFLSGATAAQPSRVR